MNVLSIPQANELFELTKTEKAEHTTKAEIKKFSATPEGAAFKPLFDTDNRGWTKMWAALDKGKDQKFQQEEFVSAYLEHAAEGIAMGASSVTLDNPARVTIAQREFVQFDPNSRYSPLVTSSRLRGSGIIVMSDSTPDEEAEIVVPKASQGLPEDEGEEPEPPAPFEYAEYM